MTLTPWSEGRSLTWDVTLVHTLSQTNLVHSVHAAGSTAEAAAVRKVNKDASLSSTHLFVPIALETLGPVCEAALGLLSTLGSRLTERSGDPRGRSFLFQRLSVAIKRGNSVALHGTFGELNPTWVATKHGCPGNHFCITISMFNPRTPRGVDATPLTFFPCNFFYDSNRKNRLSVSVTRDGRHILTYVTSSWRCHVTYVMTSYVHDVGQNTLFLP